MNNEDLQKENTELKAQNANLVKVIEVLVHKQFNDCFQYICSSQNECQTFGCAVQKRIKQAKAEYEAENKLPY